MRKECKAFLMAVLLQPKVYLPRHPPLPTKNNCPATSHDLLRLRCLEQIMGVEETEKIGADMRRMIYAKAHFSS